jgi:predicted transport protein
MTASEFEILRADLLALRADIEQQRADAVAFRMDVDRQFAQVEAKLDAKPSVAALYQAVVVMMFGLSAAITGTVVVLKNVGLLGVVHP